MINKWLVGKIMLVLVATGSIPLAAADVQVGMSSAGNGIAAWVNYSTYDISTSFYSSGTQSWSTPTVFGNSYNPPVLAVSTSGNAALAWISESNIVQATYYKATTNSWSAVQSLSSAENYPFEIIIDITNDLVGTAIVIWEESGMTTPVIRTSFATASGGGIWSSSTILSD